jgi:high-affinity nickel-transport protein
MRHPAARGLPLASVLLFTAGMSSIDTLEGALMAGAHEWTFTSPARKQHYNIILSCASVLIALGVGSFEALQLAVTQLSMTGLPGHLVATLNDRFSTLGCGGDGGARLPVAAPSA